MLILNRTLAAVVAVALAACTPKSTTPTSPDKPASPAMKARIADGANNTLTMSRAPTPADAPTELVATFAVADPQAALGDLKAYVESVAPGMGSAASAGLSAELPQGLDLSKPLYILFVDAHEAGDQGSLVLSATAADKRAFESSIQARPEWIVGSYGDLVVWGPTAAVNKAGSYMLTKLRETPAPPRPTASLDLAALIAMLDRVEPSWREDLKTPTTSGQSSDYLNSMVDGLADQTKSISVALELSASEASVNFALNGRVGSTIAKIAAEQKPSEYALLSRIPAMTADIWMAGRLNFTSFRPLFDTLLGEMEKTVGGAAFWSSNTIEAWFAAFSGEMAMRMSMTGGHAEFVSLSRVTDPGPVLKLLGDLGSQMKIPGLSLRRKRRARYRGTEIGGWRFKVDKKKLDPVLIPAYPKGYEQQYAINGNDLVLAAGTAATKSMRRVLDAAKAGKQAPLSAETVNTLTYSRARGESVLMMMDVAQFAAQASGATPTTSSPLIIGFGFADAAVSMRLTMSAIAAQSLTLQFTGASPPPAPPVPTP